MLPKLVEFWPKFSKIQKYIRQIRIKFASKLDPKLGENIKKGGHRAAHTRSEHISEYPPSPLGRILNHRIMHPYRSPKIVLWGWVGGASPH